VNAKQPSAGDVGDVWSQSAENKSNINSRRVNIIFLQCFDAVGWSTDRNGIRPKNWVSVFLVVTILSFSHLIAAVVTTTSFILSSNKIQRGDVLVPANRDPCVKWPLKRRD